MLEQLAVSFKVIGEGFAQLQKIKAKLDEVKQKIKSPFKFTGIKKGLEKIKGGFKKFGDYASAQFEKAKKKANTLTGVLKRLATIVASGFTIKTAIEGAANIEQYRNTLETVLKDPRAAKQKLAWANRFANKTPFETEEVVGGMTKLQSYGMEGDRVLKTTGRTYMEMIGDMASGMGKSFDQAIEALADARTGELERLKEFGITKNMIADFGESKGLEIFNNKGQIKDLDLFNKTLFELMDSRFGGAMEKQAKTFKGGISTIKGALKSALSTLAGVNEFGDVVENSPFQILKDKLIISFANLLVKYQEDGTFTKWAEQLATTFANVVSFGEKVILFLKEWKEVLIPVATALTGLFVINKVIVLIGALKVALAALSFNPIMLGIGLAIAAGVALYRNWDRIKIFLIEIWESIKNAFIKFWEKLKAFGSAIFGIAKKLFFFGTPLGQMIVLGKKIVENWSNIKSTLIGVWESIKNAFIKFWEKLKAFGSAIFDIAKKLFFFGTPLGQMIVLGKKIVENWDNIKAKFKEVAENIVIKILQLKEYFISLKDKVFETFNNLASILDNVWGTIKDTAKETFDNILGYITSLWEKVTGVFSGIGEKIKSLPGINLFFKSKEEQKSENINIDGSHKKGLDYVPFDGYIAELHEGERILTKEENKIANTNKTTNINRNSSNMSNLNSTKKYEININIAQVNSEIDIKKIGSIIAEYIEEWELKTKIAGGEL